MNVRREIRIVVLTSVVCWGVFSQPGERLGWSATAAAQAGNGLPGSTTTRLADGRWLILGGQNASGPQRSASIVDPATQQTTAIPAGLVEPRAGHSATLLPDGTVLIVGGVGIGGQTLFAAERFDPGASTFTPLAIDASASRARQTATVLTDGRVLIVGGAVPAQASTALAELWDVDNSTVTPVANDADASRTGHTARLLADGRVLITGGVDASETPIGNDLIFTPGSDRMTTITSPVIGDGDAPTVAEARPADGAVGVPLDVRIA